MITHTVTRKEHAMYDKTIPRQVVKIKLSMGDGRYTAGEMQIDLDTRLSDHMNGPERFIVVKDNNNQLKIINKDHIAEIMIL